MTFKTRISTQWTISTALSLWLSGMGAVAQFPPGPGGPPMREKLKLVEQFDKDGDKRLDLTERKAAREYVRSQPSGRFGRRGPRFRSNEEEEPPRPGRKISPDEVKKFGNESLYDPAVVRTLFLEFEEPDWEAELADFKNTDVEVPARL